MSPAGGALVCVVGPSGAGKDTLIDLARARLGGEPVFVFPRRLVTRAASAAEDNDALTEQAFDAGVAAGAFALHWRAHGLGYALPFSVTQAIDDGKVAICNVSRASLDDAGARFQRVATILVTAPEEVRAARIAARGRETLAEATARIERGRALSGTVRADLTIDNVGSAQEGAARLIGFVRGLAARGDVRAAETSQPS